MGEEGFRWFIGIVEDVQDPLKLGRVKVRVLNEHDEKISTDDLIWSHVLMPNTSGSIQGVGDTPNLAIGSNIIGFYLDSNEKQLAIIMGCIPIIPDMEDDKHSLSYLARGKQILEKEKIGPEPKSPYAAEYPYNRVITTRSGHVIELDDTPEHERVHIFHKSGSYVEIGPEGDVVIKSAKDRYDIVAGDSKVYIKGNANVQVDGKCDIKANKAASIASDEAIKLKAPGGVTVVGGSLTVDKAISQGDGATGTFSTTTGQRVTVVNGSVVSIE